MELETIKNVSANSSSDGVAVEKVASQGVNTASSSKKQETQEKSSGEATERQISNAIEHVNNAQNKRTYCQFSFHKEINRVAIKIIDEESEEVIREIPPEESLEMVEKMWELAGLIVDKKI